jgi:hypothetical protein
MDKSLIVAVVVIGAVIFAWRFSARSRTRPAPPPIEQIDAFMAYSAGEAVDVAKNMGIALDYSEASIKRADDALGKIRQEYLLKKSEDGVWGLSVMFGAYVGEVIRRSDSKAFWKKDHLKIGEATFPLFWGVGDDCSFPVGWCQKRILNGEEDNIVFKLEVIRANKKRANQSLQPTAPSGRG